MKITSKQYAQALYDEVCDKPRSECERVIDEFANLLRANRDFNRLDEIIGVFSDLWDEHEGVISAVVTSAAPLERDAVKLLRDYIAQRAKAAKTEIREEHDKKLLGGVVIKYRDRVIDNSLRTRLEELRERMGK